MATTRFTVEVEVEGEKAIFERGDWLDLEGPDRKKREAVYLYYAGYKPIAEGTAKELAAYFGVSKKTIQYYTTPAYAKRTAWDDVIRVVKIERYFDTALIVR